MSEIELNRLRKLRRRAEVLLSTLVSDLKPFRHEKEVNGFRRKPDSISAADDVNITTTCSCLMALALSGKLDDFYGDNRTKIVPSIFAALFSAPWMSSGLTENNAFTTTLIVRLYGFLLEAGAMSAADVFALGGKFWEPRLHFTDFSCLVGRLSSRKEPFSEFLFQLFPRSVQDAVNAFVASGSEREKVEAQVAAELTKLIRTTSFYDEARFAGVSLSKESSRLLERKLDGYEVAQLNRFLLHDFFVKEIAPLEKKSLNDIALDMTSHAERFGINDYPPAAAILYWFVDGISRAEIRLPKEHWDRLCRFAADEFGRQRSLAVAKHAAMMDPVAMAMSACLCARLRSVTKGPGLGTTADHHAMLPSTVELERSVVDLFDEQTTSGIWPKYFPLFHYQDAGSNFCFTFELLEAVLVEFGSKDNHLFEEESVAAGLERAVMWCDTNRLVWSEKNAGNTVSYNGWNSGGNLVTLRRGQPESWPTAVAHMFLWELIEVLSRHIQQRLLDAYEGRTPTLKWMKLQELLDMELWLDRKPTSLKVTLDSTIVNTFRPFQGAHASRLRKTPAKKAPVSALLFGPPGTSKTEIAKGIAAELNWTLVEIDPSHFLQSSFQNIYVQAEKIFEDVMDMSGVVILFDEMDALVQKRDADSGVDTESKFLTTYMLPKLAKLHDRGQVAFLMATNFQANFDDAIKRAGRFDFLLCIGPPTLLAKCESIHRFFELDKQTVETETAGKVIREYAAADPWLEDQLSLYTYGEFLSFISGIDDASAIGTTIQGLGKDKFRGLVEEDSKSVSLKMDDLEEMRKIHQLSKWKRLKDFDTTDFSEQEVKDAKIDAKLPAIKYVLDRRQSRRQAAKSRAKVQHREQSVVQPPS